MSTKKRKQPTSAVMLVMQEFLWREMPVITRMQEREVRKQENDHLTWNQKILTRLATEAAQREPGMEETEEESDEEEASEQDY